jgi:hypothetical protein
VLDELMPIVGGEFGFELELITKTLPLGLTKGAVCAATSPQHTDTKAAALPVVSLQHVVDLALCETLPIGMLKAFPTNTRELASKLGFC